MNRFTKETFPEKWCFNAFNVEAEKALILNKYFLENNPKKYNYTAIFCWYHSDNLLNNKSWTSCSSKYSDHTEITYDQFIKYVLNEQPITEDHSQLIKLLNDAL